MFYNCLQEKGDAQRSQRKTYCWETRWREVPNGERSARLVSARPGQQGHTEELVLQVNNTGHLQPQRTLPPNPIQRLTLNLEVTEIGEPGVQHRRVLWLRLYNHDVSQTNTFEILPNVALHTVTEISCQNGQKRTIVTRLECPSTKPRSTMK